MVECAKHELLQPFNVLHEKEGESSQKPSQSTPNELKTDCPSSLERFYQNIPVTLMGQRKKINERPVAVHLVTICYLGNGS